MKNIRVTLFLLTASIAVASFIASPTWATVATAALFTFVIGNLLAGQPSARLCATLTVNEILQDTLEAFKAIVPMLPAFSNDFSTATARKGDTIYTHISGLAAVQDYDNTSGFELNQADADSLLTDVPVVMDQLKHVPVRIKYLTELASRKNLYAEAIKNQAYVLGKSIVDAALAKVTTSNFTHAVAEATGNTSLTTLEKVRTALNNQKAATVGRFGIISPTFAQALADDQRILSSLFYGQLNGATGYRNFQRVAGFENIWEYPDLPTTSSLAAFFGDRRAFSVVSRVPDINADASGLNVPPVARFETATDPDTGMSLLAIYWQKQGTFDIWCTIAALYGVIAGTNGGAADAICDKAGYRVTTA